MAFLDKKKTKARTNSLQEITSEIRWATRQISLHSDWFIDNHVTILKTAWATHLFLMPYFGNFIALNGNFVDDDVIVVVARLIVIINTFCDFRHFNADVFTVEIKNQD